MTDYSSGQSTLLVNVCRIQPVDYESIIQSLITNTDSLWLQSMVMDVNGKDMISRIERLMEPGLINLWDYEKRLGKSTAEIKRVITLEEYAEADQYTTQLVSEMAAGSTNMVSSDYTAWNIEKKNTFSNLITAKYCGASSLLQRSVPTRIATFHNENDGSDLIQLYSKYIFAQTNIRSLSNLTIEQIIDLRKLSIYYRNEIQSKLNDHILPSNVPISIIEKDCEEITRKYCETVNEIVLENYSTKGLLQSLALDITSCFIEPLSYFLMGRKVFDLVFKRKQRGFIIYLTKLQKFTR